MRRNALIRGALPVLLACVFAQTVWAGGRGSEDERRGEYAYYRGEHVRSIALYEEAMRRRGWRTFWPVYMIGLNYCALGEWSSCLAYSREAIELNPRNGRPYGNLGQALIETGRLDEAIEWLQKGIEADAAHEALHNNLGVAYMMKGEYARSVEHFQNAIYWNEDDPLAYRNLITAFARMGAHEEAILVCREAVRQGVADAHLDAQLAYFLKQHGLPHPAPPADLSRGKGAVDLMTPRTAPLYDPPPVP